MENLERLGYNWRSVQKYCIEQRENNLIIVAPTGMGKTEAGLLWMGNTKGFFVLPLKTAINAMYERIANGILNGERIENRLALLHGDMKMYYISNLDDENTDMEHYVKVSRQMSLPITVSTMDQLFGFVFKGFAYEYKLAQLSYSKIVIDEIQVYDATLTAFLIYGIQRIHNLGGKIAVITATLPPYIKEEIERVLDGDCMYANFMEEGKNRHNIRVLEKEINSQDIIEKYNELKKCKKSSKILVVCNSVEVAQDLYEELKDYNARLVHSKFIKKDRKKLEEQILECGKTYIDDEKQIIDNKSEIWISTSMVEASLDIDFDYLFTELLDLNSLFQRFGRCNRKGAKNVTMYNCYVYTQLDEGDFILGNKGFIDKTIFELSNKAIHDINGKLSESKKQELINRYLTTENISQSHFIKKFREKYRFIDSISIYSFKKNENKLRNILSETIIPETVYEKYKEEIDTISQKLNSERLTAIERKCLRSNILQYSLEIPYYHWNSYEKAMKKGCVHQYQSINLSPGEKIKVMQCRYDEMGYYKIEFVDDVD